MVAKVKIVGRENFPKEGPVILIGNHVAVMEPVLMAVYSPKQLEFIGSIDVPHESSTQAAIDFYKMIPVFRGKLERKSIKQALEVLEQKGFLCVFPEGGLWDPGQMRAKTGISFLSHRTQAPVLPIAFIGAEGAVNAIFQLKRPEITMIVGALVSGFEEAPGCDLKEAYEIYAARAMESVYKLLPKDVVDKLHDICDEDFELDISVENTDGEKVFIPVEFDVQTRKPLAMLLHRPTILKIFKVNLKFPVDSIQELHRHPSADSLQTALHMMVNYLKDDVNGNPYLLTYRFGIDQGKAMLRGLEELSKLVDWGVENKFIIKLTPTRRFFLNSQNTIMEQIEQKELEYWR